MKTINIPRYSYGLLIPKKNQKTTPEQWGFTVTQLTLNPDNTLADAKITINTPQYAGKNAIQFHQGKFTIRKNLQHQNTTTAQRATNALHIMQQGLDERVQLETKTHTN